MASFLNFSPHLVLSTVSDPSRNPTPLFSRTRCPQYIFTHHKPFNRGAHPVAMVGFNHDMFTDPESAGALLGELRGRAEAALFTIADAAASSTDSVVDTKSSSDWLSGITVSMENVLKVLKDGLTWLHVPYSYGFAIILLTVIVKAATFPLTKKQVESAMAMRSLQPQIKAVQQWYAGDQEKIQLETARLYKLAGINPLAGCLPTLLTIPIWIGLYRALSNVANEGLLTEGFFWIPSLSGPTTISASGGGLSWLFPFLDGHPPLGWSDTFAYLVLPLLLIVSQYTSVQIMQSSQANDPNMRNSQVITNFLPLLIGYFALSVPSGLSLYWFTNNILTTVQQVWLQKLGGAKIPARDLSDYISRNDPTQIQKPVLEINSAEMSGEQGEKLTSVGLRPGERFKKLKEEEARTKRQRELEAASNTRAMSEGPGNSPDNGLNERLESVTAMAESSNGGLARPGVEEQETPSFDRLKNGRIPASSGVDGQDTLQSQQVVIEKRQDSG